jgi:large subunit ribosomal protein L32
LQTKLIDLAMAHPKRKISKTRRNKRRTHYKADSPVIAICPSTGVSHIFHRAYVHEGKLYYKGKLVSENI